MPWAVLAVWGDRRSHNIGGQKKLWIPGSRTAPKFGVKSDYTLLIFLWLWLKFYANYKWNEIKNCLLSPYKSTFI
jgi:hypothetical protein